MRFGSLFAGVGGFDIGLEAAGWECGWQVEWDKNCQQTLSHHWPNVPKWLDVSDVNGAELPPVDVITFGSPCQDLSVAGKRAGIQQEGGRSNLFFEATRIIKEMRDATAGVSPRWAIWENVPGAFTSGKGDDFEAVLKEMANLGASLLEWATLDAQFFGVPQRRRRVFILACFDTAISDRGGRPILAISEGSGGNSAKGKQARQGATTEAAEGFGNSGFSKWAGTDQAITLSARDYKGPNTLMVEELLLSFDTQFGSNENVFENMSPTLKSSQQSPSVMMPFTPSSHAGYSGGVGTLRANGGDLGGGSETLLVHETPSRESVATETPTSVGTSSEWWNGSQIADALTTTYNEQRMPDKNRLQVVLQSPIIFSHTQGLDAQPSEIASPTLRVGGAGMAVAEPTMQVRRLTPIECERLMGWPDNHTLHRADGKTNSYTTRYKMCGNGVASPVAQWIAEQINLAENGM